MSHPPTAEPAAALRKLCLLGAPGVGKTSLARRFSRGSSAPTAADFGITISLAPAEDPEQPPLSIWDVAGRCAIDSLNQAFLSRVDVLVAVASPDVRGSLETARALVTQAQRLYPRSRAVLLLNKADLGRMELLAAPAQDLPVFSVSARDGYGVQEALRATLSDAAP